MSWEIVMGLEVHAELSTKSKIFCGCSTEFGAPPNTHVCPGCAGEPGTLPVLNRAVVEYAMRLGLTLGCDITRVNTFDRKNYFYPDLSKAWQTTQLYAPVCRNGGIGDVRLHQIHMEEDAGKLVHAPDGSAAYMDYNRGGTPLLEIVTKPDFRTTEQVLGFLETLRETLLYLDICDCKMQEGSLRCDVNLSVRPVGQAEFGTRTEMKNLNSFKAIARAIEYESKRHIDVIERGGSITQETRRWDDNKGKSMPMRNKENAQDYRYFPCPDIPPVVIDDAWLESVRATLPELAAQKRERYTGEYGIAPKDAATITVHKTISALFEQLVELTGQPKEAANLITGELMRHLNNTGTLPEDLQVDAGKLAQLIELVLQGKINRAAYKQTMHAVFGEDVQPMEYIEAHGLLMQDNSDALAAAIAAAIAANPKAIADYRAGNEKTFGFIMGQVMKELKGQGNPALVKPALEAALADC
ncbi:MAG: Asp-tRNA(Asn)/Glu-tRNA(Gln) amidotransferase subunit GatB [Oscillospiraceae bacterium]|nr:Asp-tRNA(Asn)/Glu-tRNA(Gln) amidotransferase subunit GatB [Oscillospiraceae bacterium]